MHRVSRHEISKRQTSAALFPLGCYCLLVVLLAACCCAWPLAAAALLLSCCGPRATPLWPCRRFVLPSSVGRVLEVPLPPQVRPVPALAEGQLAGCTVPHAWPQAWRHTTLQARARCSGRSTGRHRVWGSGLVSGRGRIPTRACGTYVYAYACEDGHAHAASSSHRLSCMHTHTRAYVALCSNIMRGVRKSRSSLDNLLGRSCQHNCQGRT